MNMNEEEQKARIFLEESDWKKRRHQDEKELGIETTMTDEEYLAMLAESVEKRKMI